MLPRCSKGKIEQFAEEAYNLTQSEIKNINPKKRYSLLISLICRTQSRAKDSFGKMFCSRISKAYKYSKERSLDLLEKNKETAVSVADLLRTIVSIGQNKKRNYKKWVEEQISVAGGSEQVIKLCDDVLLNYGADNRSFVISYIIKNRAIFYKLLKIMTPHSSSSDCRLEMAIKFIQQNINIRSALIKSDLDLSFMSNFWKNKVVRILKENGESVTYVYRKAFEACVFSYIADGLTSGDLYMKNSIEYSDLREDLIPMTECKSLIGKFCKESGIPNNAEDIVIHLKKALNFAADFVDNNEDKTKDFSIDENGKVTLHKYEAKTSK